MDLTYLEVSASAHPEVPTFQKSSENTLDFILIYPEVFTHLWQGQGVLKWEQIIFAPTLRPLFVNRVGVKWPLCLPPFLEVFFIVSHCVIGSSIFANAAVLDFYYFSVWYY